MFKLDIDADKSKKYQVEAILNSAFYANKAGDYLPCFYYLVL